MPISQKRRKSLSALLRRVKATQRPLGQRYSWAEQVRLARENKPFRVLGLAHVIFFVGATTTASSAALSFRYVLHRTDAWLGTFYLILLAGNAVSLPFWLWLSKRVAKKTAYLAALAGYGALNLAWLFARTGEPDYVMVSRTFLFGSAVSGVILLGYSMLADASRYDYIRCGLRREGAFAGIMSLIERFSASSAIAPMGLVLGAAGYRASTHGITSQTTTALWGIYASFSLIPALTCAATFAMMLRYELTETDLRERGEVGGTP